MSQEDEKRIEEFEETCPEKLHIEKSTIFRTLMVIAVIVNIILQKAGVYSFTISEDIIAAVIDGVLSIGIIIVSWWYNNSFSKKALKAQEYLKKMKEEDMYN